MFLQNIDIYGSKLEFTINKSSVLTTSLGGIFTIFSAVAYVVLFNLMARDLYYKVNPKITEEKSYITNTNINNFTISEQSFLFAIYNLSIYDNPELYKYNAFFLQILENQTTIRSSIDLMTCDKAKYSNLFFDEFHAALMICLNLTNYINKNLTNYFYSTAVQSNIIEFSINFDYDYYNSLDTIKKEEIKSSTEIIGYFWPELSISPNNFSNPLDIRLNYNKFYLNEDRIYRNNLRFIETVLQQDTNYFIDEMAKYDSAIHVANQYANYPTRKNKNDELAKFQFYLDGLYTNKYSRIYKKVPGILAEVSGIMQLLIIIFTRLTAYFSTYKLDYTLVNQFLGFFTNEKNKDDGLVWKYQKYKEFHDIFKNKKIFIKDNYEFEIIKKPNLYANEINVSKNAVEKDKKNEKLFDENILEIETKQKNRIQTENDLINEVKIEMAAVDINNDNISDNNQNRNNNNSENENNDVLKLSKSDQRLNNENIADSFNFSEENTNEYPFTGFVSYYFPFLLSKKNKNNIKSLNYTRILHYFSVKLQTHLDFFHYLEYVSSIKLLKNAFYKQGKERLKFKYLSKHLYFMRDCDENQIIKILDDKNRH